MSHPPEPTCPNCASAYDDGYGTGRDEARTIAIEPEHCAVCGNTRKVLTCRMCGARVCRFCQGPHVEAHDNAILESQP